MLGYLLEAGYGDRRGAVVTSRGRLGRNYSCCRKVAVTISFPGKAAAGGAWTTSSGGAAGGCGERDGIVITVRHRLSERIGKRGRD